MVKITEQIIGGLLALIIGVGIAFINYCISRYILIKKPQYFASTQILRQFIVVGFLLVLFLIGGKTSAGITPLLIGGCLGITIPMFFFTAKLVKLNNKKHEDDNNG